MQMAKRTSPVKINPRDYQYMLDAMKRNWDLIPAFKAQLASDPRVKDADDSHIDTALKSIMRELD